MAEHLPPAILLMGPTASGKTACAFAISEHWPVDIISVDSAQVYRDMDLGTAKPDRATLEKYPHALVDIISPEEAYSAARFREEALVAMKASRDRGRIPLLVGGTMLYFKALLEGLAELPSADAEIRARIVADAEVRGWPALHVVLQQVDPESAARLAPRDSQRIERALEVYYSTGVTLSEWWRRQEKQRSSVLPWRFLTLGLEPTDRTLLHERIAVRFREMLENGLEHEVINLRQHYQLNADMPSMRCVGYRQVWECIEGIIPRSELCDRGIFATRQLAKRQLTWLRSLPVDHRLDCLNPQLTSKVAQHLADFMAKNK